MTRLTTTEMQFLIQNLTGHKTTVSKLKGSMKEYTRFKLKSLVSTDHFTKEKQTEVKRIIGRCFTDQWSIDVHNSVLS